MNRITEDELGRLEQINREIRAMKKGVDNKKIIKLDYCFHRLMYQAAKNNQMSQFLEKLLSHCTRFWLYIPRDLEPETFFSETLEMIKAIKTKDESLLRMATIAHIRDSVEQISNYVAIH